MSLSKRLLVEPRRNPTEDILKCSSPTQVRSENEAVDLSRVQVSYSLHPRHHQQSHDPCVVWCYDLVSHKDLPSSTVHGVGSCVGVRCLCVL